MSKEVNKERVCLKAEVDRVEGNQVVLIIDGCELCIPLKLLPRGVIEGTALVVEIATEELSRKEREKTAKELLNEILK